MLEAKKRTPVCNAQIHLHFAVNQTVQSEIRDQEHRPKSITLLDDSRAQSFTHCRFARYCH